MRLLVFLLVFSFLDLGTELRAQSILQRIPNLTFEEMSQSNFDLRVFTDPRMSTAEPADIKDSPWQVALIFGIYPDPGRAQFCGRSIISSKWVVTAAHCVVDSAVHGIANNVDVVANTTFYNQGGNRFKVKNLYPHPQYKKGSYDYDVALLRLDDTSANLKSIQLPPKSLVVVPQTLLLVSGWGATAQGSVGSLFLMFANIPLVDNDTCDSRASYNNTITPRMLCAGDREGGRTLAKETAVDQQCLETLPAPVLLGIISNGIGCAVRDKYGVYTDVRSVRD